MFRHLAFSLLAAGFLVVATGCRPSTEKLQDKVGPVEQVQGVHFKETGLLEEIESIPPAAQFDSLSVYGAANVTVKHGPIPSVHVLGSDAQKRLVETRLWGSELVCTIKGENQSPQDIQILVSVPSSFLERLRVNGRSRVVFDKHYLSTIEYPLSHDLQIEADGGSEVILSGEISSLKATVKNSSKISSDRFKAYSLDVDLGFGSKANITGSAHFVRVIAVVDSVFETGLTGRDVFASAGSDSKIYIDVSEKGNVSAGGGGCVYYTGEGDVPGNPLSSGFTIRMDNVD